MVYFREKNLNFGDMIDWIERLEMAIEVQNYNEVKLFKIVHLNLRGKVKVVQTH